jgi:hypothetical protein
MSRKEGPDFQRWGGGPSELCEAFVFHVTLDSGNVCAFHGNFPFITAEILSKKAATKKYYPDLSGTFVCTDSSGATVYEGALLLCPGC